MSAFYLTAATRCYHVVESPPIPASGGPVLCGRRLRNYGVPYLVERAQYVLDSIYMCRRCKAMYERRVAGEREAVRA